MKISVKELRGMIGEIVSEAKKKKDKSKTPVKGVKPGSYSYDEAFDFSAPLGALNMYSQQGSANWGPLTTSMHTPSGFESLSEVAIRSLVRQVIRESAEQEYEVYVGEGGWAFAVRATSPQEAKKKAFDQAKKQDPSGSFEMADLEVFPAGQKNESVTRGNIWEKAMHWYDNQKLGLGSQTAEGIEQKKIANEKKAKKKGRK